MKNFDTRVYNISDLAEWYERNQLELSPQFQRRSVWSKKAKSYLVDTLVRGKPIPKLLFTQDTRDRKNVRIVVDGQQRLRAILEYMNGDFTLSRAHNKDYAGKRFDKLPPEVQSEFLKYEVGVDLLYDLPYRDILEIFARLNTYNMRLNKQELLNSEYVGFFKQLAYNLGYKYVDYFLAAGILTDAQVTRMGEASLSSDLIVALHVGVQSNKSIEQSYRDFDDEFPESDEIGDKFDGIMSIISECYEAEELAKTNWARVHLFYTLFTSLGHLLYGLEGLDASIKVRRNRLRSSSIRVILDDISARYNQYADEANPKKVPIEYAGFIDNARRRTTDTGARVFRAEFLCRQLTANL